MAHYYTTDNNLSSPLKVVKDSSRGRFEDAQISKTDYNNLTRFANIPLEQLIKDNPGLLVFPRELGSHNDGIEENPILSMSGNPDELQNVKITTTNIMGFISCGDTELSITSRFTEKTDEDYFLHYMLQKVMAINVFQLEHSTSRNNEMDFLLYVFPYLLKKALAQGVYKAYQTFNKNDAAVKGVIDIPRHIKANIPFFGRIAYKSRERTAENDVMHLIRHTIEYIQTRPCGSFILNADKDATLCIQTVYAATQNYSVRERERVIAKNIKPFCHPYYINYKPLVTLCLLILRNQKLKYANESKKVYGILFDGAWLWEEYLATLLTKEPLNFIHPKNKTHENGIHVYKGNLRYPDFYRGKQSIHSHRNCSDALKDNFILDAKYKRLDNAYKKPEIHASPRLGRDDLHQLVTYMHILPATKGALLYPSRIDTQTFLREKTVDCPFVVSEQKELYGVGGSVFTIGFPIPQNAKDRSTFNELMKMMEREASNQKMRVTYWG